jgi:tetratricopeptide (TPR) repeat protein
MAHPPRVNLLGLPELLIDGATRPAAPYHFGLLSYFLLKGRDTISRSEIAALLWPDASDASARHSLSQLVYTLNKVAGVPIIHGQATHLTVGGINADTTEFRAAVYSETWVEAAKLFRGELLTGTEFRKAPDFDDWIAEMRRQFSESVLRVVEGLALDGHDALAENLTARLPPHFAHIIQAHAVPPAELRGDIGDLETGKKDDPTTVVPTFVGRKREIEWLEAAYTRAVSGGFVTVLLEGEPGIGKSTLVNRFGRIRALRGSCVVVARAFEAEQNIPFGIVAQWVRDLGEVPVSKLADPWKEIIDRAFFRPSRQDDNRVSSEPTGEFRLLEALRRLFLVKLDTQPVVLLLDDAHVADAASLGFVHYFSRRSPGAPVLFVASARTPALHGSPPFGGWQEVRRLRLDPLTIQDTAGLLTTLGNRLAPFADSDLYELYRRTGGNPLLIVSLHEDDGRSGRDGIPKTVTEYFLPRLEALSHDASLVLAAVAIAGHRIDLAVVTKISGIPNALRMAAAVRELESAGLVLRDTDDLITPRHGIVAEVAISRLGGAQRKSLYGRAARVLSEEGRSQPSILAIKHDIGGDRVRAFEAALQAAAASSDLHAVREREFFLKLALSNAPDPEAEARIRIELADLFQHLGRPSEGLDIVADEMVRSAPPALRSQARARRLGIRLRKVDVDTDLRPVWQEIQQLGMLLDPEAIGELYYRLAAAAHEFGRTGDAIAAAKLALSVTENVSSSTKSALIAARSATVLALYVEVDEGIAVIDELLPAVESNLEALAQCLSARGTVLIAAGRLLDAEDSLLRGIELMERCCLYDGLFSLHNNLGVCYMEQGLFDEARHQFDDATRVGREFIGPSGTAITADNMTLLHYEIGDYHSALEIARGRAVHDTVRSSRGLFQRHGIIGLCSLELGLLAQAFEAKREIELLFDQHEYWSNDVSYVETFLARMLVLEDRTDEARGRLEKAIEVYRPRDLLCRARLELELARIDLKRDPGAAFRRANAMLETLRGTGARPLIDRFEEVADRAGRRHPA